MYSDMFCSMKKKSLHYYQLLFFPLVTCAQAPSPALIGYFQNWNDPPVFCRFRHTDPSVKNGFQHTDPLILSGRIWILVITIGALIFNNQNTMNYVWNIHNHESNKTDFEIAAAILSIQNNSTADRNSP